MKYRNNIFYKIYQLFFNGFTYDKYTTILYLISFFRETPSIEIKEFLDNELLENIISGTSLIRFGDGEAMLMVGRDIHYQKTSRELARELRMIIDNYSSISPYIIGIPAYALRKSEKELQNDGRLRIWRLFRVFFKLRFPVDLKYYCAVYFYKKNNFEYKVAPLLRKRNVICVSNSDVLDNTLRKYLSEYFETVDFVFIPPLNAYEGKVRAMEEIDSYIRKYPKDNCTLLLAAGPVSKIIAYEYALHGIQAIDVGHGMEIIGRSLDYSDRI